MAHRRNSSDNSARSGRRDNSLSPAAENYLLSILQLEEQGLIGVTATQLAEQLKRLPEGEGLGTSLPSIGGMLRRMVREGLIDSSSSKAVTLTGKGRKSAESILRRHRLAERMVVDILGLNLHKAHIEAHRLEHAISADLADRIDEKLGHPVTCPFGHPIPGSSYAPAPDALPLSEVKKGQTWVIDRVPEDDEELLWYLVDNSIVPGEQVDIVEAAPYRGIITLSRKSVEVVIGYEVADRIWVRGALH